MSNTQICKQHKKLLVYVLFKTEKILITDNKQLSDQKKYKDLIL